MSKVNYSTGFSIADRKISSLARVASLLARVDSPLASVDPSLASVNISLARVDSSLTSVNTSLASVNISLARVVSSLASVNTSLARDEFYASAIVYIRKVMAICNRFMAALTAVTATFTLTCEIKRVTNIPAHYFIIQYILRPLEFG